jgi:hypothetical protein
MEPAPGTAPPASSRPLPFDADRKSGVNTGDRRADGRFAPGNSGKPKGTRHKATQAALALLSGEAEGLTRKAVELALAGDVTALRLCLERLVPPCREAPVSLNLPRLETRADASRVLSFLLKEAGRGDVTPGEAEKLGRLASEHHKAVQLDEMEKRMSRLEEELGIVPGPG